MVDYIHPDDVRQLISDVDPSKNLENDLFFSTDNITFAMRLAASEINSIPPIGVVTVATARLPFMRPILDLVVANLYDTIVHKIDREEIPLPPEASALGINHLPVVRNNLEKQKDKMRAQALPLIQQWIQTVNLNRGWAAF